MASISIQHFRRRDWGSAAQCNVKNVIIITRRNKHPFSAMPLHESWTQNGAFDRRWPFPSICLCEKYINGFSKRFWWQFSFDRAGTRTIQSQPKTMVHWICRSKTFTIVFDALCGDALNRQRSDMFMINSTRSECDRDKGMCCACSRSPHQKQMMLALVRARPNACHGFLAPKTCSTSNT